MKIRRDSWHYKLLYHMHMREPKSCCVYFWSVVFTLLFTAVGGAIIMMETLMTYLVAPFFGFYPQKFGPIPSVDTGELAPRRALFTIGRAWKLYLYQLVLLALIAFIVYKLRALLMAHAQFFADLGAGILLLLLLGTIVWLVYILASRVRRTEGWQLFREYRRAVKQRACPLIEYEGELSPE